MQFFDESHRIVDNDDDAVPMKSCRASLLANAGPGERRHGQTGAGNLEGHARSNRLTRWRYNHWQGAS